mmetsp:Transcript_43571/g.115013  ORF Transcript_43571/g.115013 Transcript_43571/m.115013 type:complete len:267 (+) Transcript_43571:337-1137(+)
MLVVMVPIVVSSPSRLDTGDVASRGPSTSTSSTCFITSTNFTKSTYSPTSITPLRLVSNISQSRLMCCSVTSAVCCLTSVATTGASSSGLSTPFLSTSNESKSRRAAATNSSPSVNSTIHPGNSCPGKPCFTASSVCWSEHNFSKNSVIFCRRPSRAASSASNFCNSSRTWSIRNTNLSMSTYSARDTTPSWLDPNSRTDSTQCCTVTAASLSWASSATTGINSSGDSTPFPSRSSESNLSIARSTKAGDASTSSIHRGTTPLGSA